MLIPILSELRLSLQQSKARQFTGRRSNTGITRKLLLIYRPGGFNVNEKINDR
jgi:hypothetical protein